MSQISYRHHFASPSLAGLMPNAAVGTTGKIHRPSVLAPGEGANPLLERLFATLAIGGLAYLILDAVLKRPGRPHIEVWKRDYVFWRDGGKCTYCGIRVTDSNHHIDHKTALARGGSNELRNLTLSCQSCNLSKGTLSAREFRRLIS